MFKQTLAGAIVLSSLIFTTGATATTCPSLTTISNGTTASATPVWDNFTSLLTCANTALAPLASPAFTGSVGIGTASPGTKLDILDTTSVTSFTGNTRAMLTLTGSGTYNDIDMITFSDNSGINFARVGAWKTGGGSYLAFGTSNNYTTGITNQALIVSPSGNVGIGTTSPSYKLSVSNAGAEGIEVQPGVATNASRFLSYNRSTSSYNILYLDASAVNLRINGSANNLSVVSTGTNFTGSIGIGTTSPPDELSVGGGGQTSTQTGAHGLYVNPNSTFVESTIENSSGNEAGMIVVSGVGYAGSWSNMPFRLRTNNADRLTIDASGSVGIGTTSPGTALHVVGTIRQTGCTAAGSLSVNASGDIICSSDGRLKNIIGDYTSGLDALSRITPKLFTYKSTPSNPVETFVHAGFIAQNVMAVIPQAAALQRDGYYSLDTTAVLAAAVNSVKELKALADRQAADLKRQQAQLAQASRGIADLLVVTQKQAAMISALQARMAAADRPRRLRTAAR